jgi:hypothetical protein
MAHRQFMDTVIGRAFVTDVHPHVHFPHPPSERRAWLLACAIAAIGVAVFVAVLSGAIGQTTQAAPPPVLAVAATPLPSASIGAARAGDPARTTAPARASPRARREIVAQPTPEQQRIEAQRLLEPPQAHISRRWMEGFYPIYEVAQRTFGVNWLLIASIHKQESAFSTAPGTYHGLNFAHCCGGPMQFNVTNGGSGTGGSGNGRAGAGGASTPSTWDLVSDSYIYGKRPASYDHMTARHPSIYDDFDAIMAAAHLLSADGAEYELNDSAWWAAYDYYGHDATGVAYADDVLARAIGWSQHGFCINCGLEAAMVQAVYAAYGAPVLAALEAEEQAAHAKALASARAHAHARRHEG